MNLNRLQAPGHTSEASAAATASPRLKNAAHEFEASMLTELLKPMREQSEFSDSDGDDGDDEGPDASMREYSTEAMAQALSEHGGIGIAQMVLAKLAPLEAREQKDALRDAQTGVQSAKEAGIIQPGG